MSALVIFDCDGVLIDSEIIFGRVLGECLIGANFPITIDEAILLGFGKNRFTLTAEIESRFGRSLPEEFFDIMRRGIDIAFERELRVIPGIEELLAALPGRRCVASNSHLDRVRHALSVSRLLPLFEPHIFSASQVERGKPAPDLFLFAARELGVRPKIASSSRTARSASRRRSPRACRSSGFAAAATVPPAMPAG